jgi:hypothetical protein
MLRARMNAKYGPANKYGMRNLSMTTVMSSAAKGHRVDQDRGKRSHQQ